ncbi:hypothetical protein J3Q64DRAFT_1839571 [Phycomyces blakesleeanus]|uniref:Uncharacterized protein n=2 Tax=Phycomyces blakesleeanus TaxID=4837 RepID=A0A163E1Q4_PHYB8|nr:hypothetical protein PHYBLDRAFT_144081 [Phycomyces blakesleeanus NRRL 1555(-)]OAD74710.1 hypothetical protein PHYBLDRAFT_144081 [Phycomyces blakesleeanus NRRL 1555(-)]|eukprot:XP_018292750.1 hypothetical protein PHYBLDRAFT_144081 [Phycomyces blakesleeanus NRRL 1555(-)]
MQDSIQLKKEGKNVENESHGYTLSGHSREALKDTTEFTDNYSCHKWGHVKNQLQWSDNLAEVPDEKISNIIDNSKIVFGLLAILKTVAGHYKYATIEDFREPKLYFCSQAENNIFLGKDLG